MLLSYDGGRYSDPWAKRFCSFQEVIASTSPLQDFINEPWKSLFTNCPTFENLKKGVMRILLFLTLCLKH